MTFLELCQLLRQEAGIAGVGPVSVINQTGINKKIVDWISRAYEEVQTVREDWDFLWSRGELTLAPNTKTFSPKALIPTLNRVEKNAIFLKQSDGVLNPMTFVNWVDFRSMPSLPQSQGGYARCFSVRPNADIELDSISLEPITLVLEYYQVPFVMTQNNDRPAFDSQLHKVLLYKALMYYGADEEAPNVYQDAAINYGAWLDRLENLRNQQAFTTTVPLA